MGIRDDHNNFAGAFGRDRGQPGIDRPSIDPHGDRSGHGWATVSIVAGVLWLFGLGSIVALATGWLARSDAVRSESSRIPSTIGLVLGVLGVIGTIVAYGFLLDDAVSGGTVVAPLVGT